MIFTWLVDVSVANAWIIHRQSVGTRMSQLEFRREIVNIYISRYGTAPQGEGRPISSRNSRSLNRVSDDLRYDGRDHFLIPTPDKKNERWAGERCSSIICTMCRKCNMGLCLKCNLMFHLKLTHLNKQFSHAFIIIL